jgi:hypothetical protein
MREAGPDHRLQSASVVEGIAAPTRTSHPVFGIGTFGPAVIPLAGEVRSLHHSVVDGLAAFPVMPAAAASRGEWTDGPEQRAPMPSCPESALGMPTLRPAGGRAARHPTACSRLRRARIR